MMTALEQVEQAYSNFQNEVQSTSHTSIKEKRQAAFADFLEVGFPHSKHEEYRYLNIPSVLNNGFARASKPEFSDIQALEYLIPDMKANVLTFIDGYYSADQSNIIDQGSFTIDNIENAPLELLQEHFGHYSFADYNPFATLNISFAKQGGFVHVAKGARVEHPIYFLNINSGSDKWVQPHHLVIADAGSQVKVIEAYFSEKNSGVDNTFLRIIAAQDSIVDHYKIQALSQDSLSFGTTHIKQLKNSVCSTYVFNLQGGFVRNNIHIELDSDHVVSNMYGLYTVSGDEKVDNHTLVDHKFPDCESNELYKGIMTDNAEATFNGKIFVQEDAQRTNAFQSNRNLLLSPTATINTKPQLEIWADDVKCSHGATIGKLNKDELFYLKSRGISEEKATSMLTYAFAREVINLINIPSLRSFVDEAVAHKLGFTALN